MLYQTKFQKSHSFFTPSYPEQGQQLTLGVSFLCTLSQMNNELAK